MTLRTLARWTTAAALLSTAVVSGASAADTDMAPISDDLMWSGNAMRLYTPGLHIIGDLGYYWADDGSTGYEPYATDGTAGGTVSLGDLNEGTDDSLPGALQSFDGSYWESRGFTEFFEVGDAVYFIADRGGIVEDDDPNSFRDNCGTNSLFRSDGTADSAVDVLDGATIDAGDLTDTRPYLSRILGTAGNKLYLAQDSSCNFDPMGLNGETIGKRIWVYDVSDDTIDEVFVNGKSFWPLFPKLSHSIDGVEVVYVVGCEMNDNPFNGCSSGNQIVMLDGLESANAVALNLSAGESLFSVDSFSTYSSGIFVLATAQSASGYPKRVVVIPDTGDNFVASMDPVEGEFSPSFTPPVEMEDGSFLIAGNVDGVEQFKSEIVSTDLTGVSEIVGSLPINSSLSDPVTVEGATYFIAGRELWKHSSGAISKIVGDDTTPRVNEINGLGTVRGKLVFSGRDFDGSSTQVLFESDGTLEGTSVLSTVPGASNQNSGVARTGYQPYGPQHSVGAFTKTWSQLGDALLVIGITDSSTSLFRSGLPTTQPDAPSEVSVMAGVPETLSLTVTQPNDGGSTISAYEYSLDEGPAVSVARPVENNGTYYTFTIEGLTGGSEYSIRVRAVNAAGAGPWSAPVVGMPRSPQPVSLDRPSVSASMTDGVISVVFTGLA